MGQANGQAPQVEPGPTPMTINIGQAFADGKCMSVLSFISASGQFVAFIDGDVACLVGEALQRQGRAHRAGITLASE